jgi:uncharacterized delta-60 repeat protein
MKKITVFLFMIASGLTAFAQGSLDRTFGNSGIMQFPGTTEIMLMDFDTEGNILCAGMSRMEKTDENRYFLTLARTDADGIPDADFGTNGVVSIRILHSAWPTALAVQPDHKILVSGSADIEQWNGRRPFLIRFNPDGTADETFGDAGLVFFDRSIDAFSSIAVLTGGSLLLGGNLRNTDVQDAIIIKLDATGTKDPAFGTDGTVTLSEAGFRFILQRFTLLSDSTLFCPGYESSEGETRLACCRTDLTGKKTAAFGQDGKWVKNTFADFDWDGETFQTALEQPDGKILLTGWNPTGFLYRMHPDGLPDADFGDNGMVSLRNGAEVYPFRDAALLTDGTVITGGVKNIDVWNPAYAFRRFASDGKPDASFGVEGELVIDISSESDYIQCMKVQGADKVVAAGSGHLGAQACFSLMRVSTGGSSAGMMDGVASDNWTVYPNPFADRISVSGNSPVKRIILYDALGRQMAVLPADGRTFVVPDVPAGIYHLLIETKEGRQITRKVIKKQR